MPMELCGRESENRRTHRIRLESVVQSEPEPNPFAIDTAPLWPGNSMQYTFLI